MALIILDGFGLRDATIGNAVKAARMPNFQRYLNTYAHSELIASGLGVGLPEGQMGNSEVGHLNLGAGRVVYQSLTRINLAVKNNELKTNKTIKEACEKAIKQNQKIHIMGLVSPGGVHSHDAHIVALVEAVKAQGAAEVYVHGFLDGRDTPPKSALTYIPALEKKLTELKFGSLATVSGRYYGMDRDKNYDRTRLAYDAMTKGLGEKFASAAAGIEASYENDISDEFVVPFVVNRAGMIEQGDTVLFANFRPDRARQIAIALSNPERLKDLGIFDLSLNVHFVSMMPYGSEIKGPVIFELQSLEHTYGDVIAANGLKQLRIAETEKYAHVTFFFDGGVDREITGATRILIDSPKVATYDLQPEMSARKITETCVAEINKDLHDTIILNFANPDMVGHTGIMTATVTALEAVDECLGQVVEAILAKDGVAIITADHGNAEKLIDEAGGAYTAHTAGPVPVIITKKGIQLHEDGKLSDVAPTLLQLLGIKQPKAMTGKSIIK